ncbi:hypothetical protein EV181_003863 [Coemansia sp. RSA 532]|nr:hypothetical protein EV181_003863 [Coemansia sp. RSA 532]
MLFKLRGIVGESLGRRWASYIAHGPKRWNSKNIETVKIKAADGTLVPVQLHRLTHWTHAETNLLTRTVSKLRTGSKINWEQVSKWIDGRPPSSCRTRYERITKKNEHRSKRKNYTFAVWTSDEDEHLKILGDLLSNKVAKVWRMLRGRKYNACHYRLRKLQSGFKARKPVYFAKRVTKKWTARETEALRAMVVDIGYYEYYEFCARVPGFTYGQVMIALEYLVAGTKVLGRWSESERQALRRLVHEYPGNWHAVSMHMPTGRTPKQCVNMHSRMVLGSAARRFVWTPETTSRLDRLVSAWHAAHRHKESAPEPINEPVKEPIEETIKEPAQGPTRVPATGRFVDLGPAASTRSAEFDRILKAFKKDVGHDAYPVVAPTNYVAYEPPPTVARSVRYQIAVPWHIIATYMAGPTAMQCKTKWHVHRYAGMARSTDQTICEGPWTCEEDVAVYKSLELLPRNAQALLPRRRRRHAIKWRRRLVKHYVEMLTAGRPGWDPMADGLAEVHMRCEFSAWYTAKFEGYRPEDPYECPFDLDLTGYQKWAAAK